MLTESHMNMTDGKDGTSPGRAPDKLPALKGPLPPTGKSPLPPHKLDRPAHPAGTDEAQLYGLVPREIPFELPKLIDLRGIEGDDERDQGANDPPRRRRVAPRVSTVCPAVNIIHPISTHHSCIVGMGTSAPLSVHHTDALFHAIEQQGKEYHQGRQVSMILLSLLRAFGDIFKLCRSIVVRD